MRQSSINPTVSGHHHYATLFVPLTQAVLPQDVCQLGLAQGVYVPPQSGLQALHYYCQESFLAVLQGLACNTN
jgi:hypothetical protein